MPLISTQGLKHVVITYTYDKLYRLKTAGYTWGLVANYSYTYDPVGNMTQASQTVGGVTTTETRAFNNGNQLTSSNKNGVTTTFAYDNNGNLLSETTPGQAVKSYIYNPRNLMTAYKVNNVNQLAYKYDGNGDRVLETPYVNGFPQLTAAISYLNDAVGLTQVFVATQNGVQTVNRFGLDLVAQDKQGATRLYLATDGLGSVRVETQGQNAVAAKLYNPFGVVLEQYGISQTTYGYTGEQFNSTSGLLYLRARVYNPNLRTFTAKDPWGGDNRRPGTMNGYGYVENNPINLTDPTGWRSCTPAQANADFETCDQNRPLEDSSSLFNFWVIPGTPGGNLEGYILVDYQIKPWGDYKTSNAPLVPILIPIRHPLNLDEKFGECSSLKDAKVKYLSGAFEMWEVTARNIMQEISGVVTSQEEWALRDAIAIANVPYNRVVFNSLSDEERLDETFHADEDDELKRYDALGMLIAGDGQFAGMSTAGYTAAWTGKNYGNAQRLYAFALVVAYGVDKHYFRDTSYGAEGYIHRPYSKATENDIKANPGKYHKSLWGYDPEFGHCQIGGELGEYYTYLFLKKHTIETWGRNDWMPTTEELEQSGGWPKYIDDRWRASEWKTQYPPKGCNY